MIRHGNSIRWMVALSAVIAMGLLAAGNASGQAQFSNATGDGLWSTVGNWAGTPGGAPPFQDNAWINVPGSGPATINTTVPDTFEIIVGQGAGDGHVIVVEGGSITAVNLQGVGSSLNMAWGSNPRNGTWEQSGGFASVGEVRAGRDGGGGIAIIDISGGMFSSTAGNFFLGDRNQASHMTISDGTVTTTGALRLSDRGDGGALPLSSAESSLTMTGGSLHIGGLLAIGARTVSGTTGTGRGAFTIGGNATLEIGANVAMRAGDGNSFAVIGSEATINVNRPSATGFEVHQDNEVNFIFDAGGISTVNITALMRWSHEDTTLNVDTTAFVGSQVFDLFTFSGYFQPAPPEPPLPEQFGTHNFTVGQGHVVYAFNYNPTSIQLDLRLLGDANLDGMVNIADLSILASHWQQSGVGWEQGDFNGDGEVTIADLSILASNWQMGVSADAPTMSFAEAMAMFDVFNGVVIPEPAAVSLLGLSLLALRRRT